MRPGVTDEHRQLEVIYRDVGDLRADARNARTHDEAQIGQIIDSIRAFGFTNPVLIDEADQVIAGHGRLEAAKRMALPAVPTLCLAWLSAEERRAYMLADNRIALNSGWNLDVLAVELDALEDFGFDATKWGFSDAEINNLVGTPNMPPGLTDEDSVPAARTDLVSKPGDVWVLGNHLAMCGDATIQEHVQTLTEGRLADLVFTDPPYGVGYDGGHAVKGKRRSKLRNDDTPDLYRSALPLAHAVSKDSAALYLWFSDSKSAAVTAAVTAAGYEVRSTIIWNKNLAQFGAIGAQYKSKHEPCLYCFKRGHPPFWGGPNNEVSVWDVSRSTKNEFHPTQKPVELAERAFRNSCPPGGVVLDMFGGSGATLIASEKTGRHARLMELDPQYVDVIVRRWQEFTGQAAVLRDCATTFDQRAAAAP